MSAPIDTAIVTMTPLQAAAIFVLWSSRKFDTLEIAEAMSLSEASIVKIIDEIRTWQRGPTLRIIK